MKPLGALTYANPLLLRVVSAGGRRWRHALIRWIYLGLLVGLVGGSLLSGGGTHSLSELTKISTRVFQYTSYLQLALMCLMAPMFAAAAITQERDAQTYEILLTTPLSNGQIVLGTLLSRLYFLLTLLLSGVPVFAILRLYGGVTAYALWMSFAIALVTGLGMSAVALGIATLRLGTSRMVIGYYLTNALLLVGGVFLDAHLGGGLPSPLAGIHPFLALRAVVSPRSYPAPSAVELSDHAAVWVWYRTHPAESFIFLGLALSLGVVLASSLGLRRWAQGRGAFRLWRRSEVRRARSVWLNPIAWREASTRAGMAGSGWLRRLILTLSLLALGWMLLERHRGASEASLRLWLLGFVWIESLLSLVLGCNLSAATISQDRECQALDLLMTTPMSARAYLAGKIRGLMSFLLPMVLLVVAPLVALSLDDLLMGREALLWPEALVLVPVILLSTLGCVVVGGLYSSLLNPSTVQAILATLGSYSGILGGLAAGGFFLVGFGELPRAGLVLGVWSPLTAMSLLLDPARFAPGCFAEGGAFFAAIPTGRLWIFCALVPMLLISWLASWFLYQHLVANFERTLRRQR